jgi:pyruvate/2-oxoglutarate dehydrogenase complex dihydrolipoamide dehydrogenase (E3) component
MAARSDLIIVGMGSGGMVAAEFAATLGVKVVVVERERVGGDCLWTGCVPSKALLASAKAAHTMRHADHYGLAPCEPRIDTARVFKRVRDVQARIAATDDNAARFEAMGIEFRFGPARLVGPRTVRVGDGAGAEELEARFILLCTGSRPAVPPIPGLRDAGFLTSETLWDLLEAPASLISIGGGPIAIELSQAFTRLGVPTTVLQRAPGILEKDEPELVQTLMARLRDEGVGLELDAQLESVAVEDGTKVVRGTVGGEAREWRAAEILLGAGRTPNVDGLGLDAAGVEVDARGVVVDDAYRTSVKSIYAAGDVAGRWLFTHAAGYEASRAVRNMFFPGSASGPFLVPWCTFTDPELAHAGLTVAQATERHGSDAVQVWRMGLDHSDRARAETAGDGAIVLVAAKGKLVGAHALAPAAGELINELAVAIQNGTKLADLASVVHVYPTLAIAIQQLAGEAAYEGAARYRWLVRSVA